MAPLRIPPDPALYRPCVGVMLINASGKAFAGQRLDSRSTAATAGDWWQMPQGGIDPGEDPQDAVLRELGEETGLAPDHVALVSRLERELFYDLPEEMIGKLWRGRFVGQRQTWFLARLEADDSAIDIHAHAHPEFSAWRWVEPERLPSLIVPFKRPVYEAVLEGFGPLLSSLRRA